MQKSFAKISGSLKNKNTQFSKKLSVFILEQADEIINLIMQMLFSKARTTVLSMPIFSLSI
ncbi:hypothetical protein, partial [Simonsiella muelleri]|uniref:hypothetical protein n=1 Tax=Simonsiella muelleri TaxID=72 RepID=UPI0023F1D929